MKSTYELSQSKKFPKSKIRKKTKQLSQQKKQVKNLCEKDLQQLSDAICKDMGLRPVRILFGGSEPHKHDGKRLKMKIHGHYNPRNRQITLYKYTAVQKKQRATLTTISTLLHELCHYFDYHYFKLQNSPHTKGFYKRIDGLIKALES